MCPTAFGNEKTLQDLYYPNDHPEMPEWFKGMEQIIRERGLWPENGLNAQCENVNPAVQIAVADGYCSPNLILPNKNLTSKN